MVARHTPQPGSHAGPLWPLFAFGLLIGFIAEVPFTITRLGVSGHDTLAVAFIAGVILHAFALAFTALATALLYYHLASRAQDASQQDSGDTQLGNGPSRAS